MFLLCNDKDRHEHAVKASVAGLKIIKTCGASGRSSASYDSAVDDGESCASGMVARNDDVSIGRKVFGQVSVASPKGAAAVREDDDGPLPVFQQCISLGGVDKRLVQLCDGQTVLISSNRIAP